MVNEIRYIQLIDLLTLESRLLDGLYEDKLLILRKYMQITIIFYFILHNLSTMNFPIEKLASLLSVCQSFTKTLRHLTLWLPRWSYVTGHGFSCDATGSLATGALELTIVKIEWKSTVRAFWI